MFHLLVSGIKSLIVWFQVIWRDQWWDHSFLFILLRFKLKLMEKGFRDEGHHIGDIKNANEIKICILLLNRIIDDDYFEMVFKHHDKKWGKLKMSFEKTDNKYLQDLKLTHPNVKTKSDDVVEEKESKRLFNLAEYLHRQDIEYLFHIINRKIRCWWN